jgi:tetratricopeptide (TPR) repeat protein
MRKGNGTMKACLKFVLVFGTAFVLQAGAEGADYFVNKQGNDANNGAGRATAFRTIQKGVDALQPGDTLTIGPGEYFENVQRADLGGPDVETVIRAEIPGTALLRGDVPAPTFTKVPGYRFVYAAALDREPNAVIEHNDLHTLLPTANVPELEFDPGFFHYDGRSQRLYISNRDLGPPTRCCYTLAVSGESGLALERPQRVVVDGLAATGFYPAWGVLLTEPVSCTVRNCVSFLNVGGITLQPVGGLGKGSGGSGNVVEDCVCYGNTFGGIVRYGAHDDVIRRCTTYRNRREGQEHFGVMHYSTMTGPLLLTDNLSWGHNFNYSVKQGHQQETLQRCVGLGFVRIAPEKMSHNLLGGGNEYGQRAATGADTVLLDREKDLDQDIEFADPLNLDFRLQSDSRFRSAAPDGGDRGPFPYKANVFYVSTTGDDEADGLSMRKPWRTLARALKRLRPGDTLYLAEGRYTADAPWNAPADGSVPIHIRGRGRAPVVLTDTLRLTCGAGVVFERLHFAAGAALADCSDVKFRNCTFSGKPDGLAAERTEGLDVAHCLFAEAPLELAGSTGATLSGNIYANTTGPAVRVDSANAVRYSDYNDYAAPATCWEVGGKTWAMADVQQQHDRYSLARPVKLTVADGVVCLAEPSVFKSIGPLSTAMGIHHEYDATPDELRLVGPFVHSTSDTTANVEWWATEPAMFDVAWGPTPETENHVGEFRGVGRFNTFSLTGLEPGQTYHFRIISGRPTSRSVPAESVQFKDATLTFRTADKPAEPRTYYVAPDGSDHNDGSTREQAFHTVCRAAAEAGPGDTVLIAGGDYPENVRIRAAGTEQRPITFRCIRGEQANIQAENLPRSFELVRKPDVRFDGLYFRGDQFWRQGFVVRYSPRVQITRCLNAMVIADQSPELLIRNCVLHGGWNSVDLSRSDGAVIENNVFVKVILRQIKCDSRAVARRNVFCECTRTKTHQTLLELSDNVTETDNCFHVRWPEAEKLAVNDMPLPEYRAATGSNAVAANPMMPGTTGWFQGWQRSKDDDFDQFFTTNPRLVLRGVGLQPEAFEDFLLGVTDWPYDRAWADEFLAATDAADALVEAGKDAEALAAYSKLLADTPMSDRLRSDVLEKASRCAQRLEQYDRAIELAKEIPVAPLAMHRQMQVMLEQKRYADIVATFSHDAMGGRRFYTSYVYPEQDDVAADLYYYRARAYIHVGNLYAAEADLRVMNDKRQQLSCCSGEAIHDLVWLRLGDFYRAHRKDDAKALEAYLNVCSRTTWMPFGTVPKPASTGASETLVKATEAACEILCQQGKPDEARKLRFNLLKAQAEASAALLKEPETLSKFKELLALPGSLTADMEACAKRIEGSEKAVREEVAAGVGGMSTGLTDDARGLLIKAAAAPEAETRQTALRTLLMFAPVDKANELLAKTKEEDRPR